MKRLAPLMVVLAATFWGCLGYFVRQLNKHQFSSLEIVAVRMIGAFSVLFLFLLIYNKKLLVIKLKDIWCFLGTGIISIVFFNYCYFTTIQLASLSVAAIMLYTAPAIVTVLGIVLFHESFHILKISALVMAFLGCACVTGILTKESTLSLPAILLGLGSGFGYAMYSIFGHYAVEKGYGSLTISVYTFLFGSIGSLCLIHKKEFVRKIIDSPDCIGSIAMLVLIGTIAAYVFYTIGLSYMEAGRASILASIEPVVATLIGFFLYKERLDLVTMIGVILVLFSAVIVNLPMKKKEIKQNRQK